MAGVTKCHYDTMEVLLLHAVFQAVLLIMEENVQTLKDRHGVNFIAQNPAERELWVCSLLWPLLGVSP